MNYILSDAMLHINKAIFYHEAFCKKHCMYHIKLNHLTYNIVII